MSVGTMTSKGQVTIPVDIRRRLGLTPGVKLDFIELPDGRVEMRPRRLTLGDLYGAFRPAPPAAPPRVDPEVAFGAALGRDDARIKREYAAHQAGEAAAA